MNEDVEERWVEVVQEMKVCRKDQVVWIRRIVPWLVARVVGDWKPLGRPRACLVWALTERPPIPKYLARDLAALRVSKHLATRN